MPPSSDSNYRIWGVDPGAHYCYLDFIEGFDDDFRLTRGDPLADEWPDGVAYRMDPAFKKHVALSDNLNAVGGVVVVSERLKAFVEAQGVRNVQFLGVDILNHKGRKVEPAYFILHPIHPQPCIDVAKSAVEWNDLNADYILSMERLVLDEARIDPSVALFRAKHLRDCVFVHQDLAAEIEAGGFSGVEFWALSDYEG